MLGGPESPFCTTMRFGDGSCAKGLHMSSDISLTALRVSPFETPRSDVNIQHQPQVEWRWHRVHCSMLGGGAAESGSALPEGHLTRGHSGTQWLFGEHKCRCAWNTPMRRKIPPQAV